MTAWHDDRLDADYRLDHDTLYDAELTDLDAHAGDGAAFNAIDLDEPTRFDDPTQQRVDAERVDALLTGASGVQFSPLVTFARPLLERYGVDEQEAYELTAARDSADATVVTLLETARLLWAFFSLDAAARDAQRGTLLTHCYGPDADAEAWEDFADLLTAMGEAWEALPSDVRQEAEATEAPTLSLEALLDTTADAAFDPGRECDARALFALPLLDDPVVQADPSRFEDALHRADAYWTLAQQPDRADRLAALLPTLATADDELPALRAEAERMLARYDDLFHA
ncbi:MAG: hypothetical protein AAFQ53_01515 [Bacteroidota bacterium]